MAESREFPYDIFHSHSAKDKAGVRPLPRQRRRAAGAATGHRRGHQPVHGLPDLPADVRASDSGRELLLAGHLKSYTLQGTTNLLLGFPEKVSNPILATPPANTYTLPLGPEPQKFYRVMVEQ